MQFRNQLFQPSIMPFNNFHKKRIVKDIPPLYIHKSKYDNLIYISIKNSNYIEIRDRDMNLVKDRKNRIVVKENIIFIDETETHLYFVSEKYNVYRYQKNNEQVNPELLHEIYYLENLNETDIIHSKLITSNENYIAILVNNSVYIINKNTTFIDFYFENIFELLTGECFIVTKPDDSIKKIENKASGEKSIINKFITKNKNMDSKGSIIESLFMNINNDKIFICCKRSYTIYNKNNPSVKEIKHEYFLAELNYVNEIAPPKYHNIVEKFEDNKIEEDIVQRKITEENCYLITENFIPTCMNIFDNFIILGLRNNKERILALTDITELENRTSLDILGDSCKKYGTTFTNSNFTTITRDNVYIYAGNEVGDITVFNINDLYDDDINKIITKEKEFVIDKGNTFISFKESNNENLLLNYSGTNKFFINNACNGRINFLYVDNLYLHVGSSNNHDVTVYARLVSPKIAKNSESLYTYLIDSKFAINYKAILEHDDEYATIKYRLHLINKDNDKIIKDWSEYRKSGMKIDDQIYLDISELNSYDYKLLVEIEDTNGITLTKEHPLDMLLDKECRFYNNKIIIPYKTIPDSDLLLEYEFYKLNNENKLELVAKDSFNVLSSYGSEWVVTVFEEEGYNYDDNGNLIKKVLPHINTNSEKVHKFDYIEIPVPNNKDILYLTYTFKSVDEEWSRRSPENNEYYIYDMSEFYRIKAISKADGGISLVDKFNILDLSYGPGIQTVNSILLRAESGNIYEMRPVNEGMMELIKLDESKLSKSTLEKIADNVNLCFRVIDEGRYQLGGFLAPNGEFWDFDVIATSNGRTLESSLLQQNLFLYKTNYDFENIENIIKALSNPIKTVTIKPNEIDNYRVTEVFNRYGESINNEHKIGYTMLTEGLAQETFKDHNHHFNVYIDGLKLPSKFIEMDVDKQGEYYVRFLYDELNKNYLGKPIEIELMHTNNIDSEKVIHKVTIDSKDDVEKLYTGEFSLYIPTIQKNIDISEFKLFIEFPLVNSVYRIDNCNYVISRDPNNHSKLYIKLKNYILNDIGCTIVLTTVDVDKQLMYSLEGTKETINDYKPYYYVPLMKYDEYGNLMYYYNDDIKSFNVVVDGYTLMPNVDYMLVNFYLHSHMPSFILFNDVLYPGSNVEITYNDEVSEMITLTNNDSSVITIRDGFNMFIDGCFSVFVEGKKLRKEQYIILDYQNLQLMVKNYERVIIKFQYKDYQNLSSLIELLYMEKSNMINNVSYDISNKIPQITFNNYLENIGYKDVDKIGKIYLIQAYSDKCFKDEQDAVYNCNDENKDMFDVNIDCNINYELPYINNDIIIDSNECYNKNDFTMTNSPLDNYINNDNEDLIKNAPKFIKEPKFIDGENPIVNPDEINQLIVMFEIQDADSIFFDYKISINGEQYLFIEPTVVGNKVFVYLDKCFDKIDPGVYTVQFAVSDGELTTESNNIISFTVAGIVYEQPIFLSNPEVLNINNLTVEFLLNIESNGHDLNIFININEEKILIDQNNIINDKLSYTFDSFGKYNVSFSLESLTSNKIINSRELTFDIFKTEPIVIKEFLYDNVDHYKKYAICHITLNDNDTIDMNNLTFKIYESQNNAKIEIKNYEYNIVNNSVYIYLDKLENRKYTIYCELIYNFDIFITENIIFEIKDLTLDIREIKKISNPVLDKFGNLTFEYSVEDLNNMSLKHEVSYNGYKYIEFNPIRCGYTDRVTNEEYTIYRFSENVSSKLKEIRDLSVRITNNIGTKLILKYPRNITLPENESVQLISTQIMEDTDRIFVVYSLDNTPDNDIIYTYYSLDDTPWIQVYPKPLNTEHYKFVISNISSGNHSLRIKISDGLTENISEYLPNFWIE